MMKVIELTKENEEKYLDQIAELEKVVLQNMKEEGRDGQLFITGKEEISEYVHSKENTVMVSVNEKDKVESVAYITQGQKPFTYNDITKYFKYGDNYKSYVRSKYPKAEEYKEKMLETYKVKIQAYQYARKKILKEHPEIPNIHEFLQHELQENNFHEKSELREKVNEYMSEYIKTNFDKTMQNQYEQFYWTTAEDIALEFGKNIKNMDGQVKEYEDILRHEVLKIYEQPVFAEEKYYTANTQNAIELDTYITSPNSRNAGCARVIVYEGIKKHMEKFFSNPEHKKIFLCSTLHRDNLSSKYVSEFFGLKDCLYVNRRQGRDREVHICDIQREQAMEYLTHMSDKLSVLYGYNPNQKHISNNTKIKVLQEQLEYEEKERKKLVGAKATDKKFKGMNVKFIGQKEHKIAKLKQQLEEIECNEKRDEDGK